jgi:hypothetical protein
VISNLPRNLPASNPPQRKLCSSTLFYLPCSVTIDQKQAQTLNTNEQYSALQSRLRKLHILESATQLFRWSEHVHLLVVVQGFELGKKKISQFGYGRAVFEEFTHSRADL